MSISAIKSNSHDVILSVTQVTLSNFLDTPDVHSRNCSIIYLCSIYNRISKLCPHRARNSRTWVQNVIQMEYRLKQASFTVYQNLAVTVLSSIELSRPVPKILDTGLDIQGAKMAKPRGITPRPDISNFHHANVEFSKSSKTRSYCADIHQAFAKSEMRLDCSQLRRLLTSSTSSNKRASCAVTPISLALSIFANLLWMMNRSQAASLLQSL